LGKSTKFHDTSYFGVHYSKFGVKLASVPEKVVTVSHRRLQCEVS